MAISKSLVAIIILVGTVITIYCFYAKHGAYFENDFGLIGITSYLAKKQNGLVLEEELGNRNITCESCSTDVPNLIIQYGSPRTATTLQFQILCLMMAFLHENEKNAVGCYFMKMKTNEQYKVIKMHSIAKALPSIPPGSWVFMTSKGSLTNHHLEFVRKLKMKNIIVPYVADVNLVAKRGHYIAYEYQKIFGFTDEKMKHVLEYLRYWDIIRFCCGMQMSDDWRNHLAPNKNYKQHHDRHSESYPACEIYDISQVETLLLNTQACKMFSNSSSLKNVIGKPSLVDGYLDGSYCTRCSANISKYKLKFNEKCT